MTDGGKAVSDKHWRRLIDLSSLLLAATVLFAGCETHVDPFRPLDDRVFSIFGVINPAADTQFIRVEALADPVRVGSAPEIDAVVALEHIESGRVVTLRDSLMVIGVNRVPVHNFWTAEPITPGATYRITATRSDGAASSATTSVPAAPPEFEHNDEFELPCVNAESGNVFRIEFFESPALAALHVLYPVEGRLYRADHFDDIRIEGRTTRADIDYGADLGAIAPSPGVLCADPSYALIVASAAGPDWPAFLSTSTLDELARPDTFTNVTNGLGLFGGVFSDTIRIDARPRESP